MKDKKKKIGFSYAWNGLLETIKTERNFRIHLFIAILVIISGFIFNVSKLEWLILITIIIMVMVAEMVNTAIERMIDYVKPDKHPEAKVIKDVAAGAVLLTAIGSIVIGLIIFVPYLWR